VNLILECPGCIVELGSWLGRSAEYFAKTAPNATIFAVDLWDNSVISGDTHYNSSAENMAIVNQAPIYDQFLSNMWRYHYRSPGGPGVVPMKMDGCEALRILHAAGVKPQLIYIDASHHYEGVVRDISTALELFPDADIVGDDWDYPDVQRAVKECGQRAGLEIFDIGYKCWTYSKQKCVKQRAKRRVEEEAVEAEEAAAKKSRRDLTGLSMKEKIALYKNKKK
jgi:hypothetical protein